MIDNLTGMARAFDYRRKYDPAVYVIALASRLVKADMGAAAVQRHMPGWYHEAVNEAKRWLQCQDPALDASLA